MPHKLFTFALFLFLLTPISFTLAQPTDPPTCDFAGCTGYTGDSSELSLDRILDYAQNGGDTDQLILDALTEAQKDQVTNAAEGRGPTGGLVPCSGLDCNMCSAVSFIDAIVKWIIGIMMVIFAIIVAYAGFKLVTSGGNPEAKTSAKKMFTNTIIGLLIVLSAWILVDTLLRALLPGEAGELNGGPFWSEIQCATQVSTVTSLPEGNVSFVDRNRENRPTEFVSTFDPGVPGSGESTGNTFNFSGNPTGDPTAGCDTPGVRCLERFSSLDESRERYQLPGVITGPLWISGGYSGTGNSTGENYTTMTLTRGQTRSQAFTIAQNADIDTFVPNYISPLSDGIFSFWISDVAGGPPVNPRCENPASFMDFMTTNRIHAYLIDGFTIAQGIEDFGAITPENFDNSRACILEKGRQYFINERVEDSPRYDVKTFAIAFSYGMNQFTESQEESICSRLRRGEECWNPNYQYPGPSAPAGTECETTAEVECGPDLVLTTGTNELMTEDGQITDIIYNQEKVYRRKFVVPDSDNFTVRIKYPQSRNVQPFERAIIPANGQGNVIDTRNDTEACYRGGTRNGILNLTTTEDNYLYCQLTPGATYFLDLTKPLSFNARIGTTRVNISEEIEVVTE